MDKHEARSRGLRLAARITGIGGIALAAAALAEAHAAAASTHDPIGETRATAVPGEAFGEAVLERSGPQSGHCGCAPCWGPPAPPPRGSAS